MAEARKPLFEYECLRIIANDRGPEDYDLEVRDKGDWIPFYLGRNPLENLSKINDIGELALRLGNIAPNLLPTVEANQRTIHDVRHVIHRARIVELVRERDHYFVEWQRS